MPPRSYSSPTVQALHIQGVQIQAQRKLRKMTAADLAERVGVSRTTLQAIEKGDPRVEVGLVMEAARVVGATLFSQDASLVAAGLHEQLSRAHELLSAAESEKAALLARIQALEMAEISIDVDEKTGGTGHRVFGQVIEWQPEGVNAVGHPTRIRLLCEYGSDNFDMQRGPK